MSVSQRQLGLAIEGVIVNFAMLAVKGHPDLGDKERVRELGLQAEQMVLQIVHEISGRWSREALEGIELSGIRMARVIVGKITAP